MGVSRLIPFLVVMVALSFTGQAHANSPYAANGIGTLVPDDAGRSMAVGGAGVARTDGITMLRGNPALLGSVSRHTYAFSARYNHVTTYMGGSDRPVYGTTNPTLLKFMLPIYKGVVFGWGISPYSRTDVTIDFDKPEGENYHDSVSSTGGINMSSLSLAWGFRKKVYAGYSLNYHFGAIEENWSRTFPPGDSLMHNTTHYLSKKFKGYSSTFGVIVKPVEKLSVGVGYTTRANLTMKSVVAAGNPTDPDLFISERGFELPSSLRAGVAATFSERLSAVFDITSERWEDVAATDRERQMYVNVFRYGGGLRFVPSSRMNASYFLKIPICVGFRAGDMYYRSYPSVETVTEQALTFGLEFPLAGGAGAVTTSFEYGTRGDKDANGWDETFMGVGVSIIGHIK